MRRIRRPLAFNQLRILVALHRLQGTATAAEIRTAMWDDGTGLDAKPETAHDLRTLQKLGLVDAAWQDDRKLLWRLLKPGTQALIDSSTIVRRLTTPFLERIRNVTP